MGLLDKLSDPYMLMQIMGGVGLLGSKRQSQADKYRDYMTQGLLGYADNQKEEKKKAQLKQALASNNFDPSALAEAGYGDAVVGAMATNHYKDKGAFGGTSVTNQAMNKLVDYQTRMQQGQPIPQELENAARMAYAQLTNDRFITTANGETIRTPGMNLGGMFDFPWAKTTPLVPGSTDAGQKPLDVVSSRTPAGQTEIDKKYAQDYVKWTTGGYSDYQKNMEQLYSSLSALDSGDVSTGPMMGLADEYLPQKLVSVFDPEFVQVKEDIEEVVQRNLREILGAQFTEKEGERLISRAFNPSLSNQQNAARLRRLLSQMERAARSKQEAAEYFGQNKTLDGFNGKTYNLSDFNRLFDEDDELERLEKELGL